MNIMFKLIKKYRNLSFEDKTLFAALFSVFTNILLAVGKFILSFNYGIFFVVAGILNILIMMAKLQCYMGVRRSHKLSFKHRNMLVSFFLLLAGLQYSIYMARLVFTDIAVREYGQFLAVSIALVSFVEMGIAIKGLFNSLGTGHYYRNIKLINLCSALTAIVLTEIALTSFASEFDTRIINGIFGMSVGAIIVLISIYIFFAPKISIVDREHNIYKAIDENKLINYSDVKITLTHSKFYGNYTYVGLKNGDIVDGHIIKGQSPIRKWNIYIKILVIVLSEILIFPYAVGALIFHFKCSSLIKKLDKEMRELGYTKIEIDEAI